MAWIEKRQAKDGSINWFVYWREAGRGSRKRCIKAGTRKRNAERLAAEIEARVNAGLVGGSVVAKRATFGEFADRWLAMRMVRPTTLRRDRGLINTYLLPVFANRLLNAIAVEDVQALLARVAKSRSPATARRLLAVLGKMLADAVKNDYARQNPVEKLGRWDRPRNRKKTQPIDLEELVNLLKAFPKKWAVLSLVTVLTGLRWGEVVSLEWSDVDFEAGRIHVRRATAAGERVSQDPKTLTSYRSVDMLWPVRKVLLDLPRRGPLLFPGVRGGALAHGWFHRSIWIPAARACGTGLKFHDLRHAFASLLLAWGEPILYVSHQLGHSNAAFTLASYAHLISQGRRLGKEETLQKLFDAVNGVRHARSG
jgi:integrase